MIITSEGVKRAWLLTKNICFGFLTQDLPLDNIQGFLTPSHLLIFRCIHNLEVTFVATTNIQLLSGYLDASGYILAPPTKIRIFPSIPDNLTKHPKFPHTKPAPLPLSYIYTNSTSWFLLPKPLVMPRGPQRERLPRRQSPAVPRRGQRLLQAPPQSLVTKPHPFSMGMETLSRMTSSPRPLLRRWTKSTDWLRKWTNMVSPTVSPPVFSAP